MFQAQKFRSRNNPLFLVVAGLIVTNISTGVMFYWTNDLNSELITSNQDFSDSNKKLVEETISLRCQLTFAKIENSGVKSKAIDLIHSQVKSACAMAGYKEDPQSNFHVVEEDKPVKLKKIQKKAIAMNKFWKALAASVALYITFLVALVIVKPFPVNNFTFVGNEPGKYQYAPSAIAIPQWFKKTAIQIIKEGDRNNE